MALKLNGRPFNPHPPTPSAARVKAHLDKAPKDEIYTAPELQKRCGVAATTMTRSGLQFVEQIEGYTAKIGPKRYFGHPVAIKELKRQLEAGQ